MPQGAESDPLEVVECRAGPPVRQPVEGVTGRQVVDVDGGQPDRWRSSSLNRLTVPSWYGRAGGRACRVPPPYHSLVLLLRPLPWRGVGEAADVRVLPVPVAAVAEPGQANRPLPQGPVRVRRPVGGAPTHRPRPRPAHLHPHLPVAPAARRECRRPPCRRASSQPARGRCSPWRRRCPRWPGPSTTGRRSSRPWPRGGPGWGLWLDTWRWAAGGPGLPGRRRRRRGAGRLPGRPADLRGAAAPVRPTTVVRPGSRGRW